MIALAVAVAGAAGAACRYAVEHWLHGSADDAFAGGYPRGTLVVNLSGSFALGLLVGATASSTTMTVAGAGFLGGYTTFSTYAVEVVAMVERSERRQAAIYALGSVVAAAVLAAAGLALGAVMSRTVRGPAG